MNDTVKTMMTRRSSRSFKNEHVDPALTNEIVSAGLRAPSGRNMQTPRFVVITDDDTVKKLSELNAAAVGMTSDPFYGARDVIAVLALREGTYVYDGSLAMGNMLNAAWSLGVGSCWIHRAKEVFDSPEGRALLDGWGLSEDLEGIGFCILGYTDTEKPPAEVKGERVFYIN